MKKGFTLIEVLIATAVFATSIMLINNIWSANILRIKKSKHINTVASLLQKKITEYELKYEGKRLSRIPKKENGGFKEFPEYFWQMESKDFEMPDLSSTLSSQEGGASQMTVLLVKTMTDFINKSVKEVKITILVKTKRKSGKPLKYSVSTVFVDYNGDLSIPGLGGGATNQETPTTEPEDDGEGN